MLISSKTARAFTQKTTQSLHERMQAANNRLSQTITTLRTQLISTQALLAREEARSKQQRLAIDELAEGYERETFGRRREVGLRIKALEREEARSEEGKRWVDRVRQERVKLNAGPSVSSAAPSSSAGGGATGKLLGLSPKRTPTRMASLTATDTGVDYGYEERISQLWDLLETGIQLFKESNETLVDVSDHDVFGNTPVQNGTSSLLEESSTRSGRKLDIDSSLGRILLAQEIVNGLSDDLERENKRNISLEKERFEYMSRLVKPLEEKQEHAVTESSNEPNAGPLDSLLEKPSHETHDLKQETSHNDGEQLTPEPVRETQPTIPESDAADHASPSSQPVPPHVQSVLSSLATLPSRYATTQKALHDCAISLTHLQTTCKTLSTIHQASVSTILDGIHDVIEDVRVEVEIAMADDERSKQGHRAVLTLNPDDKKIKAAKSFVEGGRIKAKQANFEKRLGDVEHDLIELKMVILDAQVQESVTTPTEEQTAGPVDTDQQDIANPFTHLVLRTITVRAPTPAVSPGAMGGSNGGPPTLGEAAAGTTSTGFLAPDSAAAYVPNDAGRPHVALKRGFFPALGRSFSGTTPTAPFSRPLSRASAAVEYEVNDGDVE